MSNILPPEKNQIHQELEMLPINEPKICQEEIDGVVKVMKNSILTAGLEAVSKVTELGETNN